MDSEIENINGLQKKIRELDIAFEQCQRGALIPSTSFSLHPVLVEASQKTSIGILKGHLDKYNVSQVDQCLDELGLNSVIGTTSESREEFANELNKSAKLWPVEISKQTKLIESPFPGSIEKESSFWQELEKKVIETRDKLESGGMILTKLILRRTNRVSEQLIREAEMNLFRCIEVVQASASYLRDFPIDDVQSASDIHPKLTKAIANCMQQFGKLRHSKYDFGRATQLLEVLSHEIFSRAVTLLKDRHILICDIEEMRRVKRNTDELFSSWEIQLTAQRSTLKDVAKRRNEKMRQLSFSYEALQKRLNAIFEFRENHQRLLNVFTNVLSANRNSEVEGDNSNDMIAELNEAFRLVLRLEDDLFDTSQAGVSAWLGTIDMYERHLEKVENQITRLLEGKLGECRTAEEMFRVFAVFNPLFFRPAIRNAVNAFRTRLVKNVRDDVHRLQNKFRLRYDESLERTTADLRDIPPLSGQIIWARQIENQLSTLMQRMEDVLGKDWGDHFEGKQLKEMCDELKSYLTTDQLYNDWLSQQLTKTDNTRYSKAREFLLLVENDTRSPSHKLLTINFDERQVTVFKEVRYLEWLLPQMNTAYKAIPHTIRSHAKEAFARYPTAMALQAALAGFSQSKAGINSSNSRLLVTHVQAVRDVIKEAMGVSKRTKKWIKWDSADLSDWVTLLSSKVYTLQERVDGLNEKLKTIEKNLQLL